MKVPSVFTLVARLHPRIDKRQTGSHRVTTTTSASAASANMACVIEGIDVNLVEDVELLEELVSHDL